MFYYLTLCPALAAAEAAAEAATVQETIAELFIIILFSWQSPISLALARLDV